MYYLKEQIKKTISSPNLLGHKILLPHVSHILPHQINLGAFHP